MSNELTDVRCPCGAEFQADSYDAGFIAGSGMCQNCDAALPPKDICTCPSGDGSLRHPCPAHPAEQAGGDERAAFRPAQVISYRPGVGEVTIYVAGRVPGYMNIGDTVYVSDRAPVEQPIAALAQPSPTLPPFAEKVLAKLRRFYDCAEDFESGGVDIGRHWLDLLTQLGLLNRVQRSPALWEISQQGEDLLGTPHPSPAQAEKAEVEWPEVVGQLVTWPTGQRYVGRVRERKGCKTEDVMTVAQHAASVARWAEMFNRVEQERDAALARVAELELKLDQSDYAYDNDRHHMRGMAKQAAEAIQVFTGHDSGANLAHRYGEKWWEHLDELRDALLAFAKNAPVAQAQQLHDLDKQCRDDVARALGLRPSQERGFAWSYLLASIKSCVKASEDAAQAQHSVPEGLALIPVRETEAMHDAVMALLYKGVARTDTQKLLDAYIAAAPGKEGA